MARPSFEKKLGEPAAALHLYMKESQMQQLTSLAHHRRTSKAALVREAVDLWLERITESSTVNHSPSEEV